MNSKTFIGVVILLAVVAGSWWVLKQGPVQMPGKTDTGTHVLMGSTTPDGNYAYGEETANYTIDIKYPSQTLLTDKTADQKARLTMETKLKAEADEFKKNIEGIDGTVDPRIAEGYKYALSIDYKTYVGSSTISYFYTVYEDTGGAHPNGYFVTFVFDNQGNQLLLSDLFKSGSNYLKPIAAASTVAVTKQLQAGLNEQDVSGAIFKEGLDPKDENFSNFLIDGDTLMIEIPPYQVAAYVAGSFEVRIPFTTLKAVLK